MKLTFKKFIIFIIIAAIVSTAAVFVFEVAKKEKYSSLVIKYSELYGIDMNLIYAVIKIESSYNENAVSNKGAVGLMQIMPSTADFIAKKIGYGKVVNLFEPNANIRLGCAYLKYLINKFNNVSLALAAYNAGEGNVKKWVENGKVNPFPYKETELYVKRVIKRQKLYKILSLK